MFSSLSMASFTFSTKRHFPLCCVYCAYLWTAVGLSSIRYFFNFLFTTKKDIHLLTFLNPGSFWIFSDRSSLCVGIFEILVKIVYISLCCFLFGFFSSIIFLYKGQKLWWLTLPWVLINSIEHPNPKHLCFKTDSPVLVSASIVIFRL